MMTNIKVITKKQIKEGETILEKEVLVGVTDLEQVVITEGGTTDGKIAISFVFKHHEHTFVAHCTQSFFEGLIRTFLGAKTQFKRGQ